MNNTYLILILIISLLSSRFKASKLDLTDSEKRLSAYVGIGYDYLLGNPKQDKIDDGFRQAIFNFTYEQNLMTEDNLFKIPDHCSSYMRQSCSYFQKSTTYDSSKSYQTSLKEFASVGGDLSKFFQGYGFSASIGFQKTNNLVQKEQTVIIESGARCELYELTMPMLGSIKLNENFMNFIRSAQNKTNGITWRKVLQSFGTHFVEKVIFGGRTCFQYFLKARSLEELKIIGVDVSLIAKLVTVIDVTQNMSSLNNQSNAFLNRVLEINQIYIGSEPNSDWKKWQENLKNNPVPIQYSVFSLSDLLMPYYFSEYDQLTLDSMKDSLNQEIHQYCLDNDCYQPSNSTISKKKLKAKFVNSEMIYAEKDEGFEFEDSTDNINPVMSIKSIRVVSGESINSLQLLLSDDVNTLELSKHGGYIGSKHEFIVPQGQLITQIDLTYSKYINSIRFITNKGESSYTYGVEYGQNKMLTAPPNGRLIGLRGRQRDCKINCLTAIGFIWMIPEYVN